MGRSWYELVEDVCDSLENEYEGPDCEYDDIITEIADQGVPVYTSQLVGLVESNYSLFTHESDLGNPKNAEQAIQYAAYEQLSEALYEHLRELEEKWNNTHAECLACDKEFNPEETEAEDTNFCSQECQDEWFKDETEEEVAEEV